MEYIQVCTVISQYAENGTVSSVELIFSHNEKEYRVKRYLNTSRKDALECLTDGWNIEGKKEINPKIKEILNIDVLQFKHFL